MIKILTAAAVILLSHLAAVLSELPKCCGGDNVLISGRNCSDGGPLKKLNCTTKFLLENGDDIIFDDQDNFLFAGEEEVITPDRYCTAIKQIEDSNIHQFIVCFDMDDEVIEEVLENYRVINLVLTIISIIFIVLTILVYLLLPQLLDLQGICLLQSIAGLGFSFIAFGIINLRSYLAPPSCVALAYLMYISFMYAFFWLNISCFHMWRVVVTPKILRYVVRWSMIYHIVGILGPILMLTVVVVANSSDIQNIHHPEIGHNKCWFSTPISTLIYFYGPIAILISVNIMYFIWTTYVLWGQMKHCTDMKAKILKYRLRLCLKLFFVMGIPWCFEIISALLENHTAKWIWVLPDALNALQGLFIFLILVVFRKKVIRALANKKIFRSVRLPASWRYAQDDECEELEEELSLSGVGEKLDIQGGP